MTQREKESPYEMGTRVMGADGSCGRLHRVVIDPTSKALRHLVIGRDEHSARLVPVHLVDMAGADGVKLLCTTTEFDHLEPAESTEIVDIPVTGAPGPGGALGSYSPKHRTETVTYDRVPTGEVQIRREDRLHAADGDIGHMAGLVVDQEDRITHVLLSERRLWGKREIAIPIRHVVDAAFGVQVDLTKGQVKNLPAVDLARIG
jgi:hypothetical protein